MGRQNGGTVPHHAHLILKLSCGEATHGHDRYTEELLIGELGPRPEKFASGSGRRVSGPLPPMCPIVCLTTSRGGYALVAFRASSLEGHAAGLKYSVLLRTVVPAADPTLHLL